MYRTIGSFELRMPIFMDKINKLTKFFHRQFNKKVCVFQKVVFFSDIIHIPIFIVGILGLTVLNTLRKYSTYVKN